jgi:hypothetical protein
MEQTSEGRLQTSPAAKEEGCWQIFCFWLTPTALLRNWLCSSLDSHLSSRQGSSSQLLDYKFLDLTRDIVIYGECQQSLRRPHNHTMIFKKTYNSALPKLASMAWQQLPSSFGWSQKQENEGVNDDDQPDP